MLHQDYYVREKLRELQEAQLARRILPGEGRAAKKPLPAAPVLRLAGRTLRRVGEGLEAWASPPAEREQRELGFGRRAR